MDKSKGLYSTIVAILGFICFVLAATAVGLPLWGYFEHNDGSPASDRGYFGPWRVCKELLYGREKCGTNVSRFQPNVAVWLAGLAAAIGTTCLGIFCILSVLQLAMISSKDYVVLRYSVAVICKLILSLVAVVLAITSASLFAVQTDDRENSYAITRGPSFYLQILSIIFNFILCLLALYDVIFSRRDGGDPTKGTDVVDPSGERAVTFGNPGFRDPTRGGGGGRNGRGVSMTISSGRPYSPSSPIRPYSPASTTMSTVTGSIGSVTTISTNGSTHGPLRSSLKKPKPKDGLGIQNPGFSGASPQLTRNGSVKKVRIQTHSTEV